MTLSTVPYNNLFIHHSDDEKYIFNQHGDLVNVPAADLPLDHDPVTGKPIGILTEPASENIFPDAIGMGSGITYDSGIAKYPAAAQYSMMFFTDVLFFSQNDELKHATYTFNSPVVWDYIGISFFIKFMDGSAPKLGRTYTRDALFHILINDREIMDASSQIKIIGPLNDGSYWFRGRIKSPQQPILTIKIGTERRQIQKDFILGGLQIEENIASSLIPTSGEPVTRSANWLECTLEHGKTMNSQQGTIDLKYMSLPGSHSTAMTLHHESSHMQIEVGRHGDDVIDNIRTTSEDYLANSTGIEIDDLKETDRINKVRFTYSAYGNRFSINNSPIIRTKDFNYITDESLVPTRVYLGNDLSGNVMHGYLMDFKVHGRAYTDDEIVAQG